MWVVEDEFLGFELGLDEGADDLFGVVLDFEDAHVHAWTFEGVHFEVDLLDHEEFLEDLAVGGWEGDVLNVD